MNSENKKLLEKAKNHNRQHMIICCIVVIISFVLTEILLHVPLLSINNPLFTRFFIIISIFEIISYIVLSFLLDTGTKIYRYLYWIAFFISASMMLYPITSIISNIRIALPYLTILFIMGIKCLLLWKQGQYLQHDPNAQYVYDNVLFVDDIENEKEVNLPKRKKANPNKNVNKFRKGSDGITVYFEDSSYSTLSTRIAAVVYGSLILFPILIQFMHNIFVSFDFTSNFALRGMFLACVVSALSWTIAIFYMYYNQPQTRIIVGICWIIEIIRVVYYTTILYGYFVSGSYPLRAFILFILMDAIRYYGLYYFSKQIFEMDIPISNEEDE